MVFWKAQRETYNSFCFATKVPLKIFSATENSLAKFNLCGPSFQQINAIFEALGESRQKSHNNYNSLCFSSSKPLFHSAVLRYLCFSFRSCLYLSPKSRKPLHALLLAVISLRDLRDVENVQIYILGLESSVSWSIALCHVLFYNSNSVRVPWFRNVIFRRHLLPSALLLAVDTKINCLSIQWTQNLVEGRWWREVNNYSMCGKWREHRGT